jgi:hypothetical protein
LPLTDQSIQATSLDLGYAFSRHHFLFLRNQKTLKPLTDRAAFMIISGGANIYPQGCENLLVTHRKVADAAVFGVPNEDLGEEVKAVVQPAPEVAPGPKLEAELVAFCRAHLAHIKCPRSIDFEPELPRLPTGKLYGNPCATAIGRDTRAAPFRSKSLRSLSRSKTASPSTSASSADRRRAASAIAENRSVKSAPRRL